MTVKIYGIKNCDTMKKAMTWLEQNQIDFEFHDYKKQGVSTELAETFIDNIDLDLLINKRGTTWRKLDDEVKNNLSKASAKILMSENSSVIKRPIIEVQNDFHVAFKPEQYSEIFKQ